MKKALFGLALLALGAATPSRAAAGLWSASFVPKSVQTLTGWTSTDATKRTWLVVYDQSSQWYITELKGTVAATWYDMFKSAALTKTKVNIWYDPEYKLSSFYYCNDFDATGYCVTPFFNSAGSFLISRVAMNP